MCIRDRCYDSNHIKWIAFLFVPTLFIWVLLLPLSALTVIYRNKNRLDSARMKLKYLFLYDGFTSRRFYWEFVIMYRKIIMSLIVVVISDKMLFFKCMLLLLLLFLSILLQVKCKPYIREELNQVDLISILVSVVTLYAGIFYVAQVPEENEIIFFITLIIANIAFLCMFAIVLLKLISKRNQISSKVIDTDGPLKHDSQVKISYGVVLPVMDIQNQLDISKNIDCHSEGRNLNADDSHQPHSPSISQILFQGKKLLYLCVHFLKLHKFLI
eukprot:TRINITY_DN4402_c0_g1_i1.p1 TRINITY_DN4402_c0_g1~~TRINITY_DN4402_c0_g1_i1.p1  ORF type:complete len:271 (-),score=10.13 TRINITY_DN4402_c0_g1_i1:92-904(-)